MAAPSTAARGVFGAVFLLFGLACLGGDQVLQEGSYEVTDSLVWNTCDGEMTIREPVVVDVAWNDDETALIIDGVTYAWNEGRGTFERSESETDATGDCTIERSLSESGVVEDELSFTIVNELDVTFSGDCGGALTCEIVWDSVGVLVE